MLGVDHLPSQKSTMFFLIVVVFIMAGYAAADTGVQEGTTKNTTSGLESAASAGGYYYDKSKYRNGYNQYGYGQYGGSYLGYPNQYSSYDAPYRNEYKQPEYNYNNYNNYDAYVTQNCYGQTPGMFGIVAQDCRSFSICQSDGRLDYLDCPAYLKFNNYLAVCDWPYKVDSYCNPIYKEEKPYYPEGRSYKPETYPKAYEYGVYGNKGYAQPGYAKKY